MSRAKQRAEFIAVLAANWPTIKPAIIDGYARELLSIARAQHQLAEDECNEPEPHEGERERRRIRINERVAEMTKRLPGLTIRLTGDPRGFTTKLHLPNGEYNSWGGKEEGYGVPT